MNNKHPVGIPVDKDEYDRFTTAWEKSCRDINNSWKEAAWRTWQIARRDDTSKKREAKQMGACRKAFYKWYWRKYRVIPGDYSNDFIGGRIEGFLSGWHTKREVVGYQIINYVKSRIGQHTNNLHLWQNGFLTPTEPDEEERNCVMRELDACLTELRGLLAQSFMQYYEKRESEE